MKAFSSSFESGLFPRLLKVHQSWSPDVDGYPASVQFVNGGVSEGARPNDFDTVKTEIQMRNSKTVKRVCVHGCQRIVVQISELSDSHQVMSKTTGR